MLTNAHNYIYIYICLFNKRCSHANVIPSKVWHESFLLLRTFFITQNSNEEREKNSSMVNSFG